MSQVIRYYPVHLPLGLIIIVLQSTLLAKAGHPNLLLVLILHLSGTGHFLSGGILTLFFGLILDTLSGAPAGLSSLLYLLIYYCGSLFQRGRPGGPPFFLVGLVFIIGGILNLLQGWLVGSTFPSVASWISLALIALISPFLFLSFRYIESLYLRVSHPRPLE